MGILDYLKDIERLRSAWNGPSFSPSALEREFLQLAFHIPNPTLTVREPKLYAVAGDECDHLAAALVALSVAVPIPDAIDVSGGFSGLPPHHLLFLSQSQLQTDHSTRIRMSLHPLLEQIYSANRLLTDFTLNEALCGMVTATRGTLDLREAHLFPERFAAGPYTLTVTLDTPQGTVQQFRTLDQQLSQSMKFPKKFMLDPAQVTATTALAVDLRHRLGALARYQSPVQRFSAETTSCVVQLPDVTIFYLASVTENVAVYFGKSPFESIPTKLAVFDGGNQQHTLAKLVEQGFFIPSQVVLTQRVTDIERIYDQAVRAGSRNGHEAYLGFQDALKSAAAYFAETPNPEFQKRYLLRQPPELLEFMVCPASDDPLIHDLLPRLSWHSGLRTYHNTELFCGNFTAADADGQQGMLRDLSTHLTFNNQQNNEVNLWLYHNHRQFCESAGIGFTVVKEP